MCQNVDKKVTAFPKRLLIFPAGTEIAFEIVNALKYSKFVSIYGGTSVKDHSEFVYPNLITGFPYISEDGFLEYLNEMIRKYRIEYIYPAHDSVCLFMSRYREEIGAEIVVAEYSTVKICCSKWETYRYFQGEAFIPETYENLSLVTQYPVFVKPAVGQGSKGALKVNSREELEWAVAKDDSLVICEYLPGMEYTVDCFTDRTGTLRVAKLRDRERIRAGISVRSKKLAGDEKILEIANVLNQRLTFLGAWFFQVKRNAEGEYKLMEVSPRIPGTMGLSRNLGINFPMLTLFDLWGMNVEIIDNEYDIILDKAFYSAYQINCQYEHVYVDYDDTLVIDGKVNKMLISFLYQAVGQGKTLHLLSKHQGDIQEELKKYRIAETLFNEITILEKDREKVDYIKEFSAIFIDDSFAERRKVHQILRLPVFDVDMIESLIDWRI